MPNDSFLLSCCDLYGNTGGDWTGCVAGQYGQNRNISADPLFCALPTDLTLESTSPCAPGNSGGCFQIGAWPVGCYDFSSVDGNTFSGQVTLRIAPNPTSGPCLIGLAASGVTGPAVRGVQVLDVSGRLVRDRLPASGLPASSGDFRWDGRDEAGRFAPSGNLFRQGRDAEGDDAQDGRSRPLSDFHN